MDDSQKPIFLHLVQKQIPSLEKRYNFSGKQPEKRYKNLEKSLEKRYKNLEKSFEILRHNLEVNMGSIVENMVAQILTANGFELYYYDKKNFGELDFVVQKGADVIPIEIKSGEDFTKHAAINHVLEKSDWNIKKGVVFCKGNFCETENLLYAPLYALMFFKQDKIENPLVVPEILF